MTSVEGKILDYKDICDTELILLKYNYFWCDMVYV